MRQTEGHVGGTRIHGRGKARNFHQCHVCLPISIPRLHDCHVTDPAFVITTDGGDRHGPEERGKD